LDWTEDTVLRVIDRTITPCLKFLHLPTWDADARTTFAKSLTHISSLRLECDAITPILPANVVNLHLDRGVVDHHPFPDIQRYTMMECTFCKDGSIDLRNLTTLTVRGLLTIKCRVFLPALRELALESLQVHYNAEIACPVLDLLHFTGDSSFLYYEGENTRRLSNTEKALMKPGYLLSPNTSIIVDLYWPIPALISLLHKSPKVTHVTFRFDNWGLAQSALESLVTPGTEDNSRFIPRLSELRLNFDWKPSQSSAAKEWLLDRLKARRESGVTLPLSIYVGWKGEGTYVLLTGD
jgi:hypothetical protein